jgi:hypothetical protein
MWVAWKHHLIHSWLFKSWACLLYQLVLLLADLYVFHREGGSSSGRRDYEKDHSLGWQQPVKFVWKFPVAKGIPRLLLYNGGMRILSA